MLPTPLVLALCPERRGSAVIAYCMHVPPHPTFIAYLFTMFSATPSSCQSLIMFFLFFIFIQMPLLLSLIASCVSLLAVSVLFTSLFSRAINHPHPFLPRASFVLSPLPLKSSHLPPYFSEEHSGSGLLFLLVASTRQIGLCQGCCF